MALIVDKTSTQRSASHRQTWLAVIGMAAGFFLLGFGDRLSEIIPRERASDFAMHLIALLLAIPIAASAVLWWKKYPPARVLAVAVAGGLFAFTLLPPNLGGTLGVVEQLVCSAGAALLLVSLCRASFFRRVAIRAMPWVLVLMRVPVWWWIGGLFVLFLALTISLSWYLFEFRPSYDDSLVQYIQGKIYAQGKFFITHPLQEFFVTKLMINGREQWYSIWQPLHAFFISLGFRVGAPWLTNPMLGALSLVAIYFLALRVTDEKTARLAALLTLLCPFVFFMSSEYMVHATSLLFSALFLWFFFEMRHAIQHHNQTDAVCFGLLVGLAIGMVFLIRPLTAVGVMVLFVFFFLYELWKNPKAHLPSMLAIGLGFAVCGCIQVWYNLNTTTEWWQAPYIKEHERGLPGFERGHTWLIGLLKGQREWQLLNHAMFEWFVPSTLFVLIACLTPMKNTALRLLAALLVAYSMVNMYNRFIYHIFGPRFIYELAPAIIVLTAYGMMKLPALLRLHHVRLASGKRVVQASLLITVMATFATGWADKIPPVLRMYQNYVQNKPKFVRMIMEEAKKPALVFIERQRPKTAARQRPGPNKYLWVAFLNPPTPNSPIIVARDLGDRRNRELMKYYPNHTPYLEYKGRLFPIDRRSGTAREVREKQRRENSLSKQAVRPGIDAPITPAPQVSPDNADIKTPAQ